MLLAYDTTWWCASLGVSWGKKKNKGEKGRDKKPKVKKIYLPRSPVSMLPLITSRNLLKIKWNFAYAFEINQENPKLVSKLP